jgi:hypothetical protein
MVARAQHGHACALAMPQRYIDMLLRQAGAALPGVVGSKVRACPSCYVQERFKLAKHYGENGNRTLFRRQFVRWSRRAFAGPNF